VYRTCAFGVYFLNPPQRHSVCAPIRDQPVGRPFWKEPFMADSQKNMVTIVAIIAIVILVALAIYFVRERSNSGLHIEIGSSTDVPVLVL
jgi:hypothetical protein